MSATSRRTCVVTAAVFATLLIVPAVYQSSYGLGVADFHRWRAMFAQQPAAAAALRAIEQDVDARFFLATTLRNWQADLTVGPVSPRPITDVHATAAGWYFVDADARVPRAAGLLNERLDRPTQAIRALADAADRLRARGIRLVVVPIPSKASIYPDKIEAGYDVARGPDLNVDHAAWFAALRAANVDAIDLSGALWDERARERDDPAAATFTLADSHWTWHGMSIAAAAIAAQVAPYVADAPRRAALHQKFVHRVRPTDLADPAQPAPPVTSEVRAYLLDADDRTVLADDVDAPVLVLGDSFAAGFVDEGSGLPQAIEFATGGVPTRSAAVYGGNVTSMRAPLASSYFIGPKVRVVVFAFAMRHLITSDWPLVPVAGAAPPR